MAAVATVEPRTAATSSAEPLLRLLIAAFGGGLAALFLFRLATFWLPILPGWLSFVWTQRHDVL